MIHQRIYCFLALSLIITGAGCGSSPTQADPAPQEVRTPVTVTRIGHDPMVEMIQLNATSSFLLKHFVKANANGYLRSATKTLGQSVKKGELLFTLRTKEAQNLGNSINLLDSTFKFSGTNVIRAEDNGYISQIDHQTGDYVQ